MVAKRVFDRQDMLESLCGVGVFGLAFLVCPLKVPESADCDRIAGTALSGEVGTVLSQALVA